MKSTQAGEDEIRHRNVNRMILSLTLNYPLTRWIL
jgi:hypothetical protein